MKRSSYHFFVAFFIATAAFVFHYLSLAQTQYANGWDSYFYLLQVKSLCEGGHLVSSRISFIYPLLALFKWLAGDYVLGWKVFVSICAAASVILSYFIVKKLTSDKNAALFSASITLWSPHLYYFSSQYAKNLLGFDFFLLFLLLLMNRKIYPAIVLVFVNLLIHKLTGFLSLAVLALFIAYNVFVLRARYRYLLWSILPIIALLFIPKIFGLDDFLRQVDFFTFQPQFTTLQFFDYFQGLMSAMWTVEIILVNIAALTIVFLLLKKRVRAFNHWVIPFLFLMLNIPFLKWDVNGFSYRFFIFSILFGPILGGVLLSHVNKKTISYLLITLFVGLTAISYKTYDPKLHDPKNHEYDKVINNLQNSGIFVQSELLIAHKGLAEYIKFTTNNDAMSWIPEYCIHKDSLWRITSGVRLHRLQAVIKPEGITKLGYDYFVVKEKDWQSFLHHVKEKHSDFYSDYTSWMNPNVVRPVFLRKYRRVDD